MAVRVVHVEPSEHEREATDRLWAMLLGEPQEGSLDDPGRRAKKEPA